MRIEPRRPDIIRRPELQPRGQRTLFRFVTVFAWAVWIYLLLPLFSLFAWALGIDYFRRHMLEVDAVNIAGMLFAYGMMIAGAALLIMAWSKYNIWLYRRKGPATDVPTVTSEMMCERFKVDRKTLDMLRAGKVSMLEVDDDDTVLCAWIND